jgi:hypothetical protein
MLGSTYSLLRATIDGMAAGNLESFQVVFTSQTCDTCGTTQPASESCGCGQTQARADPKVERRRLLLAPLLGSSVLDDAAPIEVADVTAQLKDWIPILFQHLDNVGSREQEPTALIEHIQTLRHLRSRIDHVELLRPSIALWRPLTTVVDALLDMTSAYTDALVAPSPSEAEANSGRGQEALNRAADAIHVVARRLDRGQAPGSIRLPGWVIARAEDAYDITRAANLMDLDAKGRPLYERITGSFSAPAGVGVGLLLDVGHVEDAFDDQRFWHVARMSYERLRDARPQFQQLVIEPQWQDHLRVTRNGFYEALLKAETLLEGLTGDRRMEVDAVLELGATLTETVGPGVLRLLLAVQAKRPGDVLRRDYTSILQMATQTGLPDVLLGFDPDVRNADAHRDFRVLADAVVLSGDQPRTVRDDVLIDIVLSALESCGALFCALDCALAEEGQLAPLDRLAALPAEDMLRVVLAASGLTAVRVEIRRERLEVHCRSLASVEVRPLTIVASLLGFIPDHVTTMRIAIRTSSRVTDSRGPLAPFRRWAGSQGLDKEAAFIELAARWTVSRRVVASTGQVRYWAAFRAAEAIHADINQADETLAVLAQLGRRLGDKLLVEALEAMRAAKHAAATGQPAAADARHRILRLTEWLDAHPGPINDGPRPPAAPPGLMPT